MMRPTGICYASDKWAEMVLQNSEQLPNGRWVPSRPEGNRRGFFARTYAAWLVFSGQADALVWMREYYERS